MPISILLLALAATHTPGAAPRTSFRASEMFISPMGEPFTASASAADPLANWFSQADRNHDGSLSTTEMEQDAARFFALLDLNHDGEIDPDETTNYETVIAPQVHTGAASTHPIEQSEDPDTGGKHADGAYGGTGGSADQRTAAQGGGVKSVAPVGPEGAGRFGLLNIPEPVMAADTNFDRGVSAAEFGIAATQRFQLLDTNHDGRLTLSELTALRR